MAERLGPSVLPTTTEICAYVWFLLECSPDPRPTQADLARAIGRTPRQLRREWAHTGRRSIRSLIAYSCLSYAQHLISDDGWKACAAVRRAGYRSHWNANRMSKRYTGRTTSQWRDLLPLRFDRDEVLRKLEELRARSNGQSGEGAHNG